MASPRFITAGEDLERNTIKAGETVTLSNDQILVIPNIPVSIIDPPESDQVILPIIITITQDFMAGVYSNIQTGSVFAAIGYIDGDNFYAFGDGLDVEGVFTDDSQIYEWILSNVTGTYDPGKIGKALGFKVTNANENFGGGNVANTLKVTPYYILQ